jgi:hypothetical protein
VWRGDISDKPRLDLLSGGPPQLPARMRYRNGSYAPVVAGKAYRDHLDLTRLQAAPDRADVGSMIRPIASVAPITANLPVLMLGVPDEHRTSFQMERSYQGARR